MSNNTLKGCIVHSRTTQSTKIGIQEYARYSEASPFYLLSKKPELEELGRSPSRPKPSIEEPPKHELKSLPSHLRYAYLDDNSKLPVIISSALTDLEEEKVLEVLRDHKAALRWIISDIKGISPSICMHKILMEESYQPTVQPQRRLNPNIQEVVKAEVLKLLDAGIIYPISDSK